MGRFDPAVDGMYLALINLGSYLDFASPVPLIDADGVIERGVLNEDRRISGLSIDMESCPVIGVELWL